MKKERDDEQADCLLRAGLRRLRCLAWFNRAVGFQENGRVEAYKIGEETWECVEMELEA